MTVRSKGGFDPDRFRKLVAMFDSPHTEEAKTALRLALNELEKQADVNSSAEFRQVKSQRDDLLDRLARVLCAQDRRTNRLRAIARQLNEVLENDSDADGRKSL